jgi:hypothetical protein
MGIGTKFPIANEIHAIYNTHELLVAYTNIFNNVIALKQNSKKHGHVYFWVDALCQMMFFSNLFLNFLNPFIF